jgi:hypothetical protein
MNSRARIAGGPTWSRPAARRCGRPRSPRPPPAHGTAAARRRPAASRRPRTCRPTRRRAHADAALQPVLRIVQAAQAVDARQQFVDHAVHQLLHLPVAPAVQPGEVGHAASGAHAAEKAIAFDEQGSRAAARRADRGGQPGRATAEHHHVEFAEDLRCRWGSIRACMSDRQANAVEPASPGRRRCTLGARRRRRFGGVVITLP